MKNIQRHDHGHDFGLLSLYYYFVLLCNEIGWHDLQIRQVSGNLQIVQCNLQIGWPIYQLADWPGQFANCRGWQIGRNINITRSLENYMVCSGALVYLVELSPSKTFWKAHGLV